jgi:hypothetical protein
MPALRDAPLTAQLEAALTRALAATWQELNQSHFKGKLKAPAIALSEAAARLGQWQPSVRTLELQRALVLEQPWGVVVEVLKHEMAHQYVSEVLGHVEEAAHGPAFRALCEKLAIDARASGLPAAGSAEERDVKVLGRIAKLLALAESPNVNEAEAAMAEAQRLMLKHNLETVVSTGYGFRQLGRPTGRVSEHERLLATILNEHFFVECIWVPVWRPLEGKRGSVLEVCGTPVNLELAEHTHAFLLHTAERLWDRYKVERGVRSDRDRRTYLAGVMVGFGEKLDAQRTHHAREGLVWVGDGDLARYWRKRHPHIRWTRQEGSRRTEAHAHGREAGRQIVLHRAMTVADRQRGRLLPGRR